MSSSERNREAQGADKGKNLGQGVANINDKDRRDLAGTGDDAATEDQERDPAAAGGFRDGADKG